MGVRIEPGGPDDVDAALDIYVRSRTEWRRGEALPGSRIDEVRATITRDDSWFFVARDGSEPIGMAVAMTYRDGLGAGPVRPGQCYLDLIFVVPELWGQGIGALLLDKVIDDAASRGFSSIHLVTHDDNERAHRLYRSRGFARIASSRPSSTGARATSEWARSLIAQAL